MIEQVTVFNHAEPTLLSTRWMPIRAHHNFPAFANSDFQMYRERRGTADVEQILHTLMRGDRPNTMKNINSEGCGAEIQYTRHLYSTRSDLAKRLTLFNYLRQVVSITEGVTVFLYHLSGRIMLGSTGSWRNFSLYVRLSTHVVPNFDAFKQSQ